MPDALVQLRAAFPVAESWIYFNHAAVCPLAAPVRAAIESFLDEASRHGSVHFERWIERRERARAKAAGLLGARAEDTAFVTSTSAGLLLVAEGLPWRSGDEIVVIEDDFPANQIPWYRQERKGARVVAVPRDADGRVPTEAILQRVCERTALVAVPTVLYDTGARLDVEALGRALADHPALLCVDAIQSLGAFPLDVERAGIDFLSADSHKWMLGIEGIGIFFAREAARARLDPPQVSWMSMAEPFAPYRRGAALRPDAARYEYACLPTMEVYGIDAALDLLLAPGPDALAARILQLTDRLAVGLQERGWSVRSPRAAVGDRSGIVAASPPGLDAGAAAEALERAGVSVAARGGAVRFSPHAWNTADEVDDVLRRLPGSP